VARARAANFAGMKTKTKAARTPSPALHGGQVWQMDGSRLLIELVGIRLVHYKHFKVGEKRPPVRLSGKRAVEQLLEKSGAVLLPEGAAEPSVTKRSSQPGSKRAPR